MNNGVYICTIETKEKLNQMTKAELKKEIENVASLLNISEIEAISGLQAQCVKLKKEQAIELLAEIKWDYIPEHLKSSEYRDRIVDLSLDRYHEEVAIGDTVYIPWDLTQDPYNKRGKKGIIQSIEASGDVTVKFNDGTGVIGKYGAGSFEKK